MKWVIPIWTIVAACAAHSAAPGEEAPDPRPREQPELQQPAPIGADSGSPGLGAPRIAQPVAAGASPNLTFTGIEIVDSDGVSVVPEAGKNFWVRVTFDYTNPSCTPYSIRRVVNGWTNDAPEIDLGCGLNGTTSWAQVWGPWVLHRAGSYSIDATLDSAASIPESDEADNTGALMIVVLGDVTEEWELVHVDAGRALLGDGTDVIVGTMDDAFDHEHPWFTGVDSKGRPRLVAANQNQLGTAGSPVNANHATPVMGIVLARGANDGDLTGLAPDARFVSAEFLNRANIPGLEVLDVVAAAGFLVDNGAEVINMSWSWWFGSDDESMTGEASVTNLMADYLAYGLNISCVPAVNQLPTYDLPTAPGSSRNVITVGGLADNLQNAWDQQDHGPTLDGRSKPDLLGNDAVNSVVPFPGWREGFPSREGAGGTSVAAPFVTGAVAQMLDYGKDTGESTDHRVIKAVVMNSGVKALDDDGSPWSNSTSQPLDDQQGTGILDLIRVYEMYSAGRQDPDAAKVPGYGFDNVTMNVDDGSSAGRVRFRLGLLETAAARLDATLAWSRHTFWSDENESERIDAGDNFFVDPADAQDNLDLVVYRDGVPIAASRSTVDTVEHVSLRNLTSGEYELVVERLQVPSSGDGEEFGLSWHADGVWIPTTVLAAGAIPDGGSVPGQPLLVDKADDQQLDLTWSGSCLGGAADYEVYEGVLGDFASHAPIFCSTSGATGKTFDPQGGNRYYLVVPRTAYREGSYGADGNGRERPVGTSVCLAQEIGSCP